jgi:hypothetical protein
LDTFILPIFRHYAKLFRKLKSRFISMGRDAMVKEIVSNGGFSMDTIIRKWHRDDAEELAKILSNKNIHDNLRDGLPFPYTKKMPKRSLNLCCVLIRRAHLLSLLLMGIE